MEFEKRKAAALVSLSSLDPDKSPKGSVDTPLIPLLAALNSHRSYFTTSSCSGRISIFSQPTSPSPPTSKKKARGGTWVFVSHDPVDPSSVVPLLFPPTPADSTQIHSLVFRFEPLIVAVECKDIDAAQSLVSLAISSGFRESGITSVNKRVIIAIRCSIRLEVPLGDSQRMLVSPEYVKYLVGIANEKMESNRKRTDGFLDALLKHGFRRPDAGGEMNGEVDCDGVSFCAKALKNCESGDSSDTHSGSSPFPGIVLSLDEMVFFGEPVERLFLWGHSACTVNDKHQQILVFGGFGGIGRHSRKNDLLLLDAQYAKIEVLNFKDSPTPRLGHISSVVGDLMYVVGGRADPLNILGDVWVFNNSSKDWIQLDCSGCQFPPRHRHAAAVIGSKIYVFGGINNDTISSSLYILDTQKSVWFAVNKQGVWPCPRHSHCMVSNESRLYVFGGYDGDNALGDLYSFDVQTSLWEEVKTTGRKPSERFSHSMFIYKSYIGVIGGCPIRPHDKELSLLDLQSRTWKHIIVNSVGRDLFVRSTANVVGDNLIMIGGGASCYAFGTKFSEPARIDLLPITSKLDCLVPTESEKMLVLYQEEVKGEKQNSTIQFPQSVTELIIDESQHRHVKVERLVGNEHHVVASHRVLQIEKKYAKLGKDILKKFGWLDPNRKTWLHKDRIHVSFPVTENFCTVYHNGKYNSRDSPDVSAQIRPNEILIEDVTYSTALDVLLACHSTLLSDEVVKVKNAPKSPLSVLREAVADLITRRGLPLHLLEQLPSRWERLGDIMLLPVTSFRDPAWDSVSEELWPIVAESLGTHRLARQGRIASTGTRDSTLEILIGGSGWVEHCEIGILYSFDATKCMFSWGNLSEKLRMACLDCADEVIIDLFAGIGYFVLPFLVRANAKFVYACEWNPHAIESLHRNLHANLVADRCIVLEGDNNVTCPKRVADRVCLGLLPSSEGSWVTAVRALRDKGGVLHIHSNVKDSEEGSWAEHVLQSISSIARSEGYCWDVSIDHVERVKWYAPRIRHVVADVRCIRRELVKQNTVL